MAVAMLAGSFEFPRDIGEGFDQRGVERGAALFHFLGVLGVGGMFLIRLELRHAQGVEIDNGNLVLFSDAVHSGQSIRVGPNFRTFGPYCAITG